jgi:uncharacterized protein
MKRYLVAYAAAVFAYGVVPAYSQAIGVGTNPQGSLAYTIGSAVAQVVTETTDLQALVQPQGGPDVTIPLVQSCELQFSIAASDIANAAYNGVGLFDGRQMEGVRVVANLMTFPSGFFVRADSDIQSLEDLKGRRVPGEYTQQRVVLGYTRTTLATVGLSLDDVTLVPVPNGTRGVEAFMAGEVDAAFSSPNAGIVAQADVAVGGVRYLPVPDTPETDTMIREMTPGARMMTVEPRDDRPGVGAPMTMMGGTFVLLAGTCMPDETVAKVVTALRDNREALVAVLPAFAEMSDDLIAAPAGALPFHPAAEAYFRSAGLITQ